MPGTGHLFARLRRLAIVVLALGYPIASHFVMLGAGDSALALAFVVGPFVVLGLAGLWRAAHRVLALAGFAVVALLGALVFVQDGLSPQWLYLGQHAGVHVALGTWFGSTLAAGRQPLISALASRLHGGLTPALAVYTRRVTVAWTAYFFGMAALSIEMFLAATFAHWSVLANLVTPVAIGTLFVGEYLLRYRLHPEFERVTMASAVRAWRTQRDALSAERRQHA
jgi:uncharacterized membrane protein